jgi:DNA polymerase
MSDLVKTLEWMIDAGVSSTAQAAPRTYFGAQAEQPKAQNKPVVVGNAANQQQTALKNFPQNQNNNPNNNSKPAPSAGFVSVPVSNSASVPSSASLSDAILEARKAAESAKTLAELQEAVNKFDGCALKKTANKTVFADGDPSKGVMLIGEAPGADEDVQGIPFCGASGKLLDKVLFSIGLTRKDGFYITNTLFWRPPGNRKPTPEELAICEPFLEKHIALVKPKVLLLVGATAVQGVLKNSDAMAKLRGKSFAYKNQYMEKEVPVLVTYHPSFLLRSPLNKRLAWEDMLFMQAFLKDIK